MAESLRDQLLKSGLGKEVREEKKPSGQRPGASGAAGSSSGQAYAGNRPKQGGRGGQGGQSGQQQRQGGGQGQRQGGGQDQRQGGQGVAQGLRQGGQGGGQGQRHGQGQASAQAQAGGKSRQQGGGRPTQGAPRAPRTDGEIDLAKAYAIRAQTDATERRRIEAEAAEVARLRKEKKRKVEELLKDKALNRADADQVRHFPYGDKIRRVYLDAAQLAAVNAGELGIVQQGGRYIVVEKAVIEALREVGPEFIALMVDPNAVDESDDGVPDDLMW